MHPVLGSKPFGLRLSSAPTRLSSPCARPALTVVAKFGGKGSSRGGRDENPLNKFFGDMKGKFDDIFSSSGKNDSSSSNPWAQGSSGGSGRGGPGGRGGGGGGDNFFSGGDRQPSGPQKTILEEILAIMKMCWVVFWNLALFLGVASILHRSLNWCCKVELLLLVGAPQQAFERVASRFFAVVEWLEANLLGWDIPQETDQIPTYQNIALYYPEQHAYTFDAYRYGEHMTPNEKKTLLYSHALRHYEREGGYKGDIDPQDVQKIQDKYDPWEADRNAYRSAAARGELDKYWEERPHFPKPRPPPRSSN